MTMQDTQVLTLAGQHDSDLLADSLTLLARSGALIRDMQHFEDMPSGALFLRILFAGAADHPVTAADIGPFAEQRRLDWSLRSTSQRRKVLILVSKFDHCLGDLLYRMRVHELPMDVVGIISNHPRDVLNISLIGDINYHYLPVTAATRPAQETEIKRIVEESGAELMILARYMQILSDDLSSWLSGRCINIHHSFLPGFKGAKPYHQAYARGVKIIGATAHYVTVDLDEGPIICQDVEHISHADGPEDLVRKGRNIEQRVLSRAVLYHLQDRVLINGAKTVVFRD